MVMPFFFHTKVGLAPPNAGIAVNVTVVFAQTLLPGLAEIATVGV